MDFKTPSPRGTHFSINQIFPNRFNPNEMEWGIKKRLNEAVKNDEYDPIIISPIAVFYPPEVIETLDEDEERGIQIWMKAYRGNVYIICDGEQRFLEAKKLGLETIRAVVWSITEKDAMPYFYKRQAIHGELDPLKEAELFLWERDANGLTMVETAEKYNRSGKYYIRDRLKLLKAGPKLLDLFWEPPPDAPGKLTITHLRVIAGLPSRKWQTAVALITLHRNWTTDDTEEEVRRIKASKGLRDLKAYLAPLEHPPPTRETPVREIKPPTEPIQEEEPLSDEKVFEEYPEKYLEEPEPAKPKTERKVHTPPLGQPKVTAPPDSWVTSKPRLPPRILDRDMIEAFVDGVLERAVIEGLDLTKAVMDELEKDLDYETQKYFFEVEEKNVDLRIESLIKIVLRGIQIGVILEGERKT